MKEFCSYGPAPARSPGLWLLLLFSSLSLLSPSAGAQPRSPDAAPSSALTCQTIPRLLNAYLQNHVQYHELTPELQKRVAESNLRLLDPSRSLFLDAEAEELKREFGEVFAALSRGDCAPLERMQAESIERYVEMEEFVRAAVSREDYAIDESARLVVDAEKRGFPKNGAARDDLYRRLIHFQMSNYVANGEKLDEAKQKLIHRYELMTRRAREMKRDEVYARFLNSFATALDPHSAYLTPDNSEDFKIHMGLSLQGIGAVLSSRDGYTVVEEIVVGGPADRSRQLKKNDKIVAVGQGAAKMVDVIDMDLRDVVRMIRGEKGTSVRLAVLRPGESERIEIRLVRDKVNLEEQAAKLRFEKVEAGGRKLDLAVLELPSFYGDKESGSRQATDDVAKLLREARAAKADGLLLDLSRNGGGLLDYAVKITGFFISEGGVVAVGDTQRTYVHEDPDEQVQWSGPLVVLTSRVTASAAEILAGAVKDYRRGVLVGDDHTFGKGSVQTVAPLPPGLGLLKLTSALYYRPRGQSTQQLGVPVDIVVPALTANDDLGEKTQPYSLAPRSIEGFAAGKPAAGNGYAPIDDATIAALAARSRERVGADTRFAEIEKELAEQRANRGEVKIADLLEKKDKSQSRDTTAEGGAGSTTGDSAMLPPSGVPGDDDKQDDRKPQLDEALRILADLVARERLAMNP